MSTIAASTTTTTAYTVTADTTGALVLQTGATPTTAVTVSSAQVVTLANALPVTSGGTGQTSAQSAMNTFAGAVTSGSYLRGNGTNVVMSTIQVADVPTLNQNTTGSAATVTGNATGSTFGFNSGYGSVATAYGCRAWVNFDGTTASPSTIRGSGNVTSVTKNSTGNYTVNFTNALVDVNYACTGTCEGNGETISVSTKTGRTTSAMPLIVVRMSGGANVQSDNANINVAVLR